MFKIGNNTLKLGVSRPRHHHESSEELKSCFRGWAIGTIYLWLDSWVNSANLAWISSMVKGLEMTLT